MTRSSTSKGKMTCYQSQPEVIRLTTAEGTSREAPFKGGVCNAQWVSILMVLTHNDIYIDKIRDSVEIWEHWDATKCEQHWPATWTTPQAVTSMEKQRWQVSSRDQHTSSRVAGAPQQHTIIIVVETLHFTFDFFIEFW